MGVVPAGGRVDSSAGHNARLSIRASYYKVVESTLQLNANKICRYGVLLAG
jgi:hypothetical protein